MGIFISFTETPNVSISCTVMLQEKDKIEPTTVDFVVPYNSYCCTALLLEYLNEGKKRENRERGKEEKGTTVGFVVPCNNYCYTVLLLEDILN